MISEKRSANYTNLGSVSVTSPWETKRTAMRQFIRHPTNIPINYSLHDVHGDLRENLQNINEGGLCFGAHSEIRSGTTIRIVIPVCDPPFRAEGKVVWCRRTDDHYSVGVRFDDSATEFAIRMVEQICHIEQYKNDVLEGEGHELSSEEAAAEWISTHAKDFPR